MANPIDIVANAIRTADGNQTMGAGQLAAVVLGALGPILDEIDDKEAAPNYTEDGGGDYAAGWHGAMHALRGRLGLA